MAGMKAAVIGCGGMGSGHAMKAKDLGLELVGFCDEIEASATRLRDTIGARLRHHRQRADHARRQH